MTRRRLPIRWRLTLSSAALLALALLLFGAGLYVGVRQRLNAGLDEQLHDQVEAALASAPDADGAPVLTSIGLDQAGSDVFLRVLDGRGAVVTDSGYEGNDVPLDRAVVAAALAGQTRVDTATLAGDDTLRVITTPVPGGG